MATKADKLLGLDADDGESRILVQKEGALERQDLNSRMKSFKKMWGVVKDGFLLLYSSKDEKVGPFDTKPKCVVPLGGAVLSLELQDRRCISLKHPDVPGVNFRLRSSDAGEAMDWLVALEAAKKSTWENALLGNALIEKMKSQGSKLEKEKEEAFQSLKEKAEKLSREREQTEKVVQRDAEREELYKEKLENEKKRITQLESARSEVRGNLTKEEEAKRLVQEKRMEMEAKLTEAEDALQKLEEAMIIRTADQPTRQYEREDEEVRASVGALKSFFEARAKENAVRAKAMYERLV